MKRKFLINFYSFFLVFFVFLFFVLFLSTTFAADLEVPDYPILPTGNSLTSDPTFPEYLLYVFDFGMFIGFSAVFFSFIYAGILFMLSGAIPEMRTKARDRASGAFSGLLLLALLYLIITTINPDLTDFTLTPLAKAPVTNPTNPTLPGVYFYNTTGCSGNSNPLVSNIDSLQSNLRNRVNSVKIVPSNSPTNYFVSLLYGENNYWGRCQYINPNSSCNDVASFGLSASVYTFDFSPSGAGVYLYRQAFKKDGGWLFIPNSDIKKTGGSSLYLEDLANMRFNGSANKNSTDIDDCTVPEDEQDCKQYDKKGICCTDKTCAKSGKVCPTLAEDGITSMKIDGSYVIVLIYDDPAQSGSEFTFCQEFPTKNDTNKKGPNQVKWEHIKNNGKNPNKILIFPVK